MRPQAARERQKRECDRRERLHRAGAGEFNTRRAILVPTPGRLLPDAVDDALDPAIITGDRDALESARFEQRRGGVRLTCAHFHRQRSAGVEHLRRARDDASHEGEPVGAAVERDVRLVVLDVCLLYTSRCV